MKKKEDLRVTKTKKNLYEGLLLMMKDKPFEDIKVIDICQKALTNRSTFYDHFQDKYELLDALMNDLKENLDEHLEENKVSNNPKEFYVQVIELFFSHINENIDTYNAILKMNNNSIVMDMAYDTILKNVEKHIGEDSFLDTEVPLEIISKFYVSGVINVCLEYIKFPNKYRFDDILEYLKKLLPNKIY